MDGSVATLAAVRTFLAEAKPKQRLIYVTGRGLPHNSTASLIAIRSAYNDGLIDLVQRRIGKGAFAYLAIRRLRQAVIRDHGRFGPHHNVGHQRRVDRD